MLRFALLAACLALLQISPSNAGLTDWMSSNSCSKENTHNYYFGQSTPYQRLLYMDRVKYDWKLLRTRSEDLTYPVKGQKPAGIISYMEVMDMKKDGTGGCAYIKNGGVGNWNVSIHLKSQPGETMDFEIKIFGH